MPTDHPDTAPSDLAPAARGTAIRSAEVLVTSPDRNFVTLRITTEDGVVGLGDATLNGRELSVASYLADHVVPLLLGRDAHRIEDTWQFLYRSAYWRRGPVTMAAIAAVDVALWDIKAKVAGLPLYQLLGGASRTGIMAYGHASGAGPARAVRLDPATTRSRASARSACRPRSRASTPSTGWPRSRRRRDATTTSPRSALPCRPRRTGTPAPTCGTSRPCSRPCATSSVPSCPLLHDGHHRMTPIQAARLGKDLEPYDLFWLEDCTPGGEPGGAAAGPAAHHHPAGDRRGVQHRVGLPDAGPRAAHRLRPVRRDAHRRHHRAAQDPRLRRAVPDQVRHPRADRHLPRRHGGRAAPGPGDPQLRHPGVHAARRPDRRGVPAVVHVRGRLPAPGRRVGLGVTYDDDAAARYPYEQAYLPFNRLKDGTVHDW